MKLISIIYRASVALIMYTELWITFPSTKMKLDRNVVDATLVIVDCCCSGACVKTLNGLVAWASKPNSCSKPPSKSTSLSCPLHRKNQLKPSCLKISKNVSFWIKRTYRVSKQVSDRNITKNLLFHKGEKNRESLLTF